ncbi:GGDEF domain-containing protein [Amycolatopsis sp. QT-25]|uniref:GGDEF domain-containing protein n=1 Tax=Amycolatopsis sp. QT-25 TaxID=3034022 RepID=UPI0023EB3C3A|nr:GGDEF domain-containing protein [Amycolatopsis sp. QT-25]WET81237.1 GGDEF domain-containing protein [Amycolatopsis sp. QT-25]
MALTNWALWRLPHRGLIGFVLLMDVAAIAGSAWFLVRVPVTHGDAIPFAVLITSAVLYTELSRPVERVRERFAGTPHISLDSVWTFAAVLLVHPALAALVIAVSFFYRWFRGQPNPLFRRTFSASATVLAGFASAAFLSRYAAPFDVLPRDTSSFGSVIAAGGVFLLVNTVFMTVAVYYGTPHERLRDALAKPFEYALEAATIALGIIVAWALRDWPVMLLLVVGITLVLHRGVLLRQLRRQARSDAKTGLLNAKAWREAAADELDRAGRAGRHTSLLMVDVDRFKLINDRHGHLVGDRYLAAIAETLRTEVRGTDLVGRFGGEEFVVLLPGTSAVHAHAIAERIRSSVASRADDLPEHVTVSIGLADRPGVADLDTVLAVADRALYEAKNTGRNRTSGYQVTG